MDAAKVLRGEMDESELDFKMPEDGRIWGTAYPRPTAVAKATGTLDYGADLGLKMPEGTLQLALVQATVSHANIKNIDISEAEKMPGVYKVVTHKDIKGKNRITGLITFPTNLGDGWDRPILCDEKVFQFGDAIAIVCADTYENACAAAEKVKVDLEVLPAYMSAPAAMAEDALEIHPGTPNVYYVQNLEKGEPTAPIFEKAPNVVEDDFYVQRQPHMTIEPDVGFAYIDDNGVLKIHSKTIGAHLHLLMIAPGLGLEPDQIALVSNPMGGTFGYKFCPTMEGLVGAAALATGKPLSLIHIYGLADDGMAVQEILPLKIWDSAEPNCSRGGVTHEDHGSSRSTYYNWRHYFGWQPGWCKYPDDRCHPRHDLFNRYQHYWGNMCESHSG